MGKRELDGDEFERENGKDSRNGDVNIELL